MMCSSGPPHRSVEKRAVPVQENGSRLLVMPDGTRFVWNIGSLASRSPELCRPGRLIS